jgi:uncharacterized protein
MPSRPPARLDPRSPFVVDTRDLGRRAGAMREFSRALQAPDDWALDLVRVPAGAAVSLDLRLEAVVDGVLVTAQCQVPVVAECGRCLEPISSTVDVSMSELFEYEPEGNDDEAPALDGDYIDLAAALHDSVVLALPLNPVCAQLCAGLCPGCGARLAEVEPGHTHDAPDPRWAVLAALQQESSATMESAPPAGRPAARTEEH